MRENNEDRYLVREGRNATLLAVADGVGGEAGGEMASAAAIDGTSAFIGNLGDSRAYLLRDGDIRMVTADHSGEYQSSITRFVCDPRGVQPDVFVETLRPGDRLLLCSDGLTRHVPDADIASTIRRKDLGSAASALVDLAKSRGGEDNITVVLYAARRTFGLADLRRNFVNLILALLVAVVVGGTIAALIFASGAYPIAR